MAGGQGTGRYTVNDGRVARVVDAQQEQERLSGVEDYGSNSADKEGHPWVVNVRASRDGD